MYVDDTNVFLSASNMAKHITKGDIAIAKFLSLSTINGHKINTANSKAILLGL